jgi:hypothetical protein
MNCFGVSQDCKSINFNHSPDASDQNEIKVVDPTLRTYGGGRECDRLFTPHPDRLPRDLEKRVSNKHSSDF